MSGCWIDDRLSELKSGSTDEVVRRHLQFDPKTYARWGKVERPKWVVGSDEVGLGALAGPLVVCSVRAPYGWTEPYLRDSKKLTGRQLQKAYMALMESVRKGSISFKYVSISSQELDSLGVATATRQAHWEAATLAEKDDMVVVDGDILMPGDVVCLVKADTYVPQVMAASIIAKVLRDTTMCDLSTVFPSYGFDKHVGYGTEAHYEAIKRHGPCEIHRRSYKPFREDP